MHPLIYSQCRLPLLSLLLLVLSGCATAPNSLSVGERVKQAALKGATDPITWGGLAGASLLSIGEADYRLSDWAREKTPVFGGKERALDASDTLRRIADYGSMGTIIAAPASAGGWVGAKAEGLLDSALSHSLTLNLTGVFKREVGRWRPHRQGNDSFPSAHSSTAFNYSAMAGQVVPTLAVSDWAKTGLSATFNTLAVGTAWARVEGGVHYPSDVLVGAALGNFFGIFVYELMLGPDRAFQLGFTPVGDDGYAMQARWAY